MIRLYGFLMFVLCSPLTGSFPTKLGGKSSKRVDPTRFE